MPTRNKRQSVKTCKVLSSRKCNFNQKENPCNQLENSIRGDIGCINLSDIKNGCRTSKSQKSFYDMYKKSIKTCTDYKVQYPNIKIRKTFL